MDRLCSTEHAKLLSGICPWCGQFLLGGQVGNAAKKLEVAIKRQTLQQLIEEQGVRTWRSAISIVKQIAKELNRYHKTRGKLGILSPRQILVSENAVHISETTLSLLEDLVSDDSDSSCDTQGIADYLAPEQALDTHRADGRADIYSLGCILYFLLLGHPPFSEGSITERLLKHQTEIPPSINTERDDIPTKLLEITEKMLAKDPQDRQQSAEELLADLKSISNDVP